MILDTEAQRTNLLACIRLAMPAIVGDDLSRDSVGKLAALVELREAVEAATVPEPGAEGP